MPSLLGERGTFLALARISWWEFRARTALRAGNHMRAEKLYARCVTLAGTVDDDRLRADLLINHASVLTELGRTKEAMAVSAPLLPNGRIRGGADATYVALTVWIEGAVELAVSAPAIEQVLAMLENHIDSTGHLEWRCAEFHLRSRLLSEQGRTEEALMKAKEGWAMWRRHQADSLFSEALLGNDITYLAGELGRPDEIRRILAELTHIPVMDLLQRKQLMLRCEYDLAFAEGRHADAVRLQEQALNGARYSSNSFAKFEHQHQLAYSRVAAQHIEDARRDIVRLVAMRHSSTPAKAYYFRMLCGDVHLAAARRALGLPSMDFDMLIPGVVGPPDGADPIDPVEEARRARLAYRVTRPLAEQLDQAFQGTRYRNRLRKRLTLLDEAQPALLEWPGNR